LDETYFCWRGGFSNSDAFYYRIQGATIIIEFHLPGIFLSNKEPATFHARALVTTPNGGEYAKAYRPFIEHDFA
jgi:hypothetical protein